jgi:hypothetical protein
MTILERYYWWLWHSARVVGYGIRIVAEIIGICALADLFRLTSFGYPDWTILAVTAFFAAGYGVSSFGRLMLRIQYEKLSDSR